MSAIITWKYREETFRGWANLQLWIPARTARMRFVTWRDGQHRARRWRPQRTVEELAEERRRLRAPSVARATVDSRAAAMAVSARCVAVLTLWFGKQYWTCGTKQFEARWRYERLWTQIWFPNPSVRRRVDAGFSVFLERDARALATGQYNSWLGTPLGTLAIVLLYGPLHRAMNRGLVEELQAAPKALAACKNALNRGFDRKLRPIARAWIYMALVDSEHPGDAARGSALLARLIEREAKSDGSKVWARFTKAAAKRLQTVTEFGRFPQRNIDLLRRSTKAERLFVAAHVPLRSEQWDLSRANQPREPVFLDSRARHRATIRRAQTALPGSRGSRHHHRGAAARGRPKANIGRRASPWDTIVSFDIEPMRGPSPEKEPFRHEPFKWHHVTGSSARELKRVERIKRRLPPLNDAGAGRALFLAN